MRSEVLEVYCLPPEAKSRLLAIVNKAKAKVSR